MGTQVTSEVFLQPIVRVHRNLENEAKATCAEIRQNSDGLVPCIADIRRSIGDVRRLSELTQQDSWDGADLVSTLQIQAVGFDNICKALLLMVADSRQDVENMFEDPHHPVWVDAQAHQSLEKKMARFYDLCLESLEHCGQVLNEIQKGLQMAKKRQESMKYVYGRNALDLAVPDLLEKYSKLSQEKLRIHFDVFSTLVRQAVIGPWTSVTDPSSPDNPGLANDAEASDTGYGHLRYIHVVSQCLYDTLSSAWTCREHEAHKVQLSLDFLDAKASGTISCKAITFNVVVAIPSSSQGHGRDLLALKIQAECSSSSGLDVGADAWNVGRQEARNRLYLDPRRNTMGDLGLEEDLCLCLRRSCASIKPTRDAERTCLGYLEPSAGHRFELFYVLREKSPRSLDDLLWCKNPQSCTIPVEKRLRLALFLGAGFLYLRTSSWLQQVWSIKDVHLFNADEFDDGYDSAEIFLQAQLNSSESQRQAPEIGESSTGRSGLLSLALILIEVAFSAPWRKLQLREDTTNILSERERNFIDLMRLSHTVSRELGSRYARVVRTCLSEGLNAESARGRQAGLDKVIYEDIVGELFECLSAVSDDSSKLYSHGAWSFC